MGTFAETILLAVFVAVSLAVIALAAAVPLHFLWNWLMPELFGLKSIGYWQAWGLFWLCGLLFKSSSLSSSK